MAEIRKKLTDTQVKQITFTQQRKQQAEIAYRAAADEAERVLALVFDAVGIQDAKEVTFDETTNELVVGAAPAAKKAKATKSVNGA